MDTNQEIRACILFADFTEEESQSLKDATDEHEYLVDQAVCREGDAGDSMFILTRGEVKILKSFGPNEKEIARLSPGDFFGEMSLLDGQPRSATVVAVKPSAAIVLSSKKFASLMDQNNAASSKLMHALLKIMSKRLRDTNELLRKVMETEIEQKEKIEEALHVMMMDTFSNRMF